MSNTFVVLMGIGTVFFGLICLILLSSAMSAVCRRMGEEGACRPGGRLRSSRRCKTPPFPTGRP